MVPADDISRRHRDDRGRAEKFRGWKPGRRRLLRRARDGQHQAFWTAHKEFYEADVLGPMLELLAELAPEFGEGRVFRPYRDTRFSLDKSPYKTNIAAHNDVGYLSLSADALRRRLGPLHALVGPAGPLPGRGRRRQAGCRAGRPGEAGSGRSGIEVTAHEVLKSAPRGYPKDHPRIELLRHKGLTAWKEWPAGPWLATAASEAPGRRGPPGRRSPRQWLDANVGSPE